MPLSIFIHFKNGFFWENFVKYVGPPDRSKKGKEVDLRFEPEAKKKKKKSSDSTSEYWEIDDIYIYVNI